MDDPEISGDFRDEAGRFAKGNPGKPVGLKNKFTRIKEEILDLWYDGKMKESILKLMQENPKEAKAILQVVASLMPKEDRLEVTTQEPLTIRIENESDRQHSPDTAKP